MILELIVFQKQKKYILFNHNIYRYPYPPLPDQRLIEHLKNVLTSAGVETEVKPILYVERYARKWEDSNPPFSYFDWILGNRRLDDRFLSVLVSHISLWRTEMRDEMVMDRVYNTYTAWRHEKELKLMEDLL